MDSITTHYSPPGTDRTACGRSVIGCEASDFLRDADCKRCLTTTAAKDADDRRFTVNVWDMVEGVILHQFHDQTSDQVATTEAQYENDPEHSVQIEED